MRRLLYFLLTINSLLLYSQNDTIGSNERFYPLKKINIGINYDIKNTNYTFHISNGIEIQPLIHFEDFPDTFLYKLAATTNFNKDFGIQTLIGYTLNKKHIKQISLEVNYYNYPSTLKIKNISVSATKFIQAIQSELIIKPAYQEISNFKNIGLEFGLQKVLLYNRLFSEVRIGYYFNYFSYHINAQAFVYKQTLGLNIGFDKIENFNFIKTGINYILPN